MAKCALKVFSDFIVTLVNSLIIDDRIVSEGVLPVFKLFRNVLKLKGTVIEVMNAEAGPNI
jgi:hypothetical protein